MFLDYTNIAFHERFKKLRKEANKSQKDLTDKSALNISEQTIKNYEQGKRTPDVPTLIRIAEYFNVSTDYLVGLSDIPSRDTNIQAVCEFTGLGETAIYEILSHTKAVGIINDEEIPITGCNEQFKYILDTLLCSKYFWSICEKISFFSTHADEPDFNVESIQNNEELLSNPEKLSEMYFNKADSDRACKYLRFEIQEDMSRICDIFGDHRPMLDMLEQQEILKILHDSILRKRNQEEDT